MRSGSSESMSVPWSLENQGYIHCTIRSRCNIHIIFTVYIYKKALYTGPVTGLQSGHEFLKHIKHSQTEKLKAIVTLLIRVANFPAQRQCVIFKDS